jgi:hypothetical protein
MRFDAERVRADVREATTEDLLDRVTVYRAGMEPEAVDIIEAELRRRGVSSEAIDNHHAERGTWVLTGPDGTALSCSFCRRPAVVARRGWHRLFGLLPLIPRTLYYCQAHEPP